MRTPRINKYALYEQSVQSARQHVDWTVALFRELRGSWPRRLREDFCGTFAQAAEWVKRNRHNHAEAVDLDPEPLRYGSRVHRSRLNAEQRRRLQVIRADVTTLRSKAQDVILVGNFSFYVLKTRAELLNYFRSCHRSLGGKGILFLEMAGGPGFIREGRERRTFRLRSGKPVTYVWEQKSFNPISAHGLFHIHFKLESGETLHKAFTYDWRVWTIPEVRELLAEAGFGSSVVYWETEFRGKGTGEYERTEEGTNDYSWIAYVVGMK